MVFLEYEDRRLGRKRMLTEASIRGASLLAREVNVKEVESLSYPVTTFAESRVVEVSRRAAIK